IGMLGLTAQGGWAQENRCEALKVRPAAQFGEVVLPQPQSVVSTFLNSLGVIEPAKDYTQDERIRLRAEAVGRLDVMLSNDCFQTCTATLVGPDRIVTADHCFGRYRDKGGVSPIAAHVVFGHLDSLDTKDTVLKRRVDLSSIESLMQDSGDDGADIAFARLDRPLNTYTYAEFAKVPPEPNQLLYVIGHPKGLFQTITRGACRVLEISGIQIVHTCDTEGGSSGAPIFLQASNLIVGIHTDGVGPESGLIANKGFLVAPLKNRLDLLGLSNVFETEAKASPTGRVYDTGETFRDCVVDCPEMVVIPPGDFLMGSPDTELLRGEDEGPQRRVRLAYKFAVSKTEITRKQYQSCVEAGACKAARPIKFRRSNNNFVFDDLNHPVAEVTWDEASAYASWLSILTGQTYRLLSEAEWEYAARAGKQARYSWGDHAPVCRKGAINAVSYNRCTRIDGEMIGDSGTYVHDLKVVPFSGGSAFGLHDMQGNVGEWVADCYQESMVGLPDDGRAHTSTGCAKRVVRGGNFRSGERQVRVAARWASKSDSRYEIGIRVARELPQ
ncbi:MAG: SUMF1/EgtB/PvdO family nonheme iron enzyme, partial [Pseudomonadota bacterium]|nr:SUMF1/EgtB/PvdO family nonheme iron enzyme [Pseudomonadota bacterium]